MPGWAAAVSEALPRWAIRTNAQNLGYVFGQNMYTPQNLLTNGLIKTDRPYAGWLYGGVYLQRRGQEAAHVRQENETKFQPMGVRDRLLARRNTHG